MNPTAKKPSRPVTRLMDAAAAIQEDPPDEVDFLHSILCEVGIPRSRTERRTFERNNDFMSIRLEAGALYLEGEWVEQPLPYGTKPRLVMIHVSTEAVRTRDRAVAVGRSMSEFLRRLGLGDSGGRKGPLTLFKTQMQALAACRMQLGFHRQGRSTTITNAQPIEKSEAWVSREDGKRIIWPGTLELSEKFFNSLQEHAVPLDYRAVASLSHSSLALDVYTYLAHRLCRIGTPKGLKLTWRKLQQQFGQEFSDPKNFKHSFIIALKQALAVYPTARVEPIESGLLLKPSPPPVSGITISVPPSYAVEKPRDN